MSDIESRAATGDTQTVHRFLVSVVDRIGMHVLAGPMVARETGPPQRAGVSGVVILSESHAAIHTYPALGEAFVDIFSCRAFDPALVETVFEEFFGRHRLNETGLASRGRHWDGDVANELQRCLAARSGQ
ncbi:MAG: S-adenosylmethionine decarboxylase [Acidimicrobiales bacterium]